jgi:hypothetical protein
MGVAAGSATHSDKVVKRYHSGINIDVCRGTRPTPRDAERETSIANSHLCINGMAVWLTVFNALGMTRCSPAQDQSPHQPSQPDLCQIVLGDTVTPTMFIGGREIISWWLSIGRFAQSRSPRVSRHPLVMVTGSMRGGRAVPVETLIEMD